MRLTDRILGLTGVGVAAFFIWHALQIEEPFITDVVGPKMFPIIICVVLGLASLVILLRPDPNPDWPGWTGLREVLAGVVVCILYAQLLPEFGFVISTFFASAALSWRLGSKPVAAVLAGLGVSLGIYIIFHLILGLSLARGPLGF